MVRMVTLVDLELQEKMELLEKMEPLVTPVLKEWTEHPDTQALLALPVPLSATMPQLPLPGPHPHQLPITHPHQLPIPHPHPPKLCTTRRRVANTTVKRKRFNTLLVIWFQ